MEYSMDGQVVHESWLSLVASRQPGISKSYTVEEANSIGFEEISNEC